MNHGERAHATWSASATTRNWNCSGALALGNTVEHLDIESEAAAWGTACHQVAEKCLRTEAGQPGWDAAEHIGETIKTKRFSFEVDEEMAETAQVYIDYVVEQWQHAGTRGQPVEKGLLFIEQRFSLAELNPPFDAGGTCDAIIYNPDERLLEVVDLKGGRGIVVEAHENKQLRTYALCAMLGHPELKVERIRSTIVQPRAPHKDGRIRSETYHVADLLDWTTELLERMQRAKTAEEKLTLCKGELMLEAWADEFLCPGDHCTFCPAEGICPALEKKALAVANAFFHPDGKVEQRNTPDEMDPAVLANQLDGFDMLQNWMNARRALAQRLAETGTEIHDPVSGSRYYLADKIGHRKFKAQDPEPGLRQLGLTAGEYTIEKMASPAQIEKTLGKRKLNEKITLGVPEVTKTRGEWLADLIHKPITGRTLVSAAKSTKPKVKSKAEAFFS